MNKLRLAIFIFAGVLLLVGTLYLIFLALKPKVAGIYISTKPSSSVWLNGSEVGKTPFRENTIKPGETVIELIPDSPQNTLTPYETKVNLVAGVETVIRYDFGVDEEKSGGEIISFEKNARGDTSLVAVSIPDSAQLVIDGGVRAFTPYKTTAIKPGEHLLKFSAQGYIERNVKVRIYEGYKLTAVVKLAKGNDIPLSPTLTPTPTGPITSIEEVEILSTDIGYLRVRNQPASSAEEIGKVVPGKRYKLLEIDGKSGWFRIGFVDEETNTTKTGWVSNQYARKVGGTLSPTPRTSTSSGLITTPTAQ